MKFVIYISIAVMLLSLNACNREKCETQEGPRTAKNFPGASSSSIELNMVADISLTIDSARLPETEVIAQEGVLDLIRFDNNMDELSISLNECIKENSPILMNLIIPELRSIVLNSAGKIQSSKLIRRDNLRFSNTGLGDIDFVISSRNVIGEIKSSGDLILAGSCDKLDFLTTASGDLRAYNLVCDTVSLNIIGSSVCDIYSDGVIQINFIEEGTVNFRGNPDTIIITGAGKVNDTNL